MSENKKESFLSPFVMEWWKSLGYCVHGEVSVFGKGIFIDHVAHKGDCKSPTDVVCIEMKRGANKSLRKQITKIQGIHVGAEEWGVVLAKPTDRSLHLWEGNGRYRRAGLLWCNSEGSLEIIKEPSLKKTPYRKPDSSKLLLVKQNLAKTSGHSSSDVDQYYTHWSILRDYVLAVVEMEREILFDTLCEIVYEHSKSYKNPKSAVKRVLVHLQEDLGVVVRIKDKISIIEK